MKYYTENELQNFRFEGAYIAETCAVNGIFEMILDNVTILPQNSCNRDIREMRANELKLKIREPEITAFVEEGYKVYDATFALTTSPIMLTAPSVFFCTSRASCPPIPPCSIIPAVSRNVTIFLF